MHKIIIIVAFFTAFLYCKKKVPEQQIQFTIDAVSNSISIGKDFPVLITLTSAMPSLGINIEITTNNEINGSLLPQGAPFRTSNVKNTVVVSGLPQQVWCNVTIKVTSNNTISNTASQRFRVIYK